MTNTHKKDKPDQENYSEQQHNKTKAEQSKHTRNKTKEGKQRTTRTKAA